MEIRYHKTTHKIGLLGRVLRFIQQFLEVRSLKMRVGSVSCRQLSEGVGVPQGECGACHPLQLLPVVVLFIFLPGMPQRPVPPVLLKGTVAPHEEQPTFLGMIFNKIDILKTLCYKVAKFFN